MPVSFTAAKAAEMFQAVGCSHGDVAVVCHRDPDADAIGSAAAVAAVLFKLGARVWSVAPGVLDMPQRLRTIPGADLFTSLADQPRSFDLVVVVDCASAERLGPERWLLSAAPTVLMIDHHASNGGFGTHQILDPDAASTATLVLGIVEELDSAKPSQLGYAPSTCFQTHSTLLTPAIGEALYAGLVTDTGSFRWGGAAAHKSALTLLSVGIDAERVSFEQLDARSFASLSHGEHPGSPLRLIAQAKLRPAACNGLGVVQLIVGLPDSRHLSRESTDEILAQLRSVREAAVAVVVAQIDERSWTISLRSRSKAVDVGAVATALGGGGHRAAAGATIDSPASHIAERIRRHLG